MNTKQHLKRKGIYLALIVITIFLNCIVYYSFSWKMTDYITDYLTDNISFLYVKKPILLSICEFFKLLALGLIVNIIYLLIIEFVLLSIFRKQLNKLLKTENLFTIKNIIFYTLSTLGLQIFLSIWIWIYYGLYV